jgi:hypothetical protein
MVISLIGNGFSPLCRSAIGMSARRVATPGRFPFFGHRRRGRNSSKRSKAGFGTRTLLPNLIVGISPRLAAA